MPISIKANETLFMAYTGLIASGYELTDKNDTEIMYLVDDIRNTGFWDDIIKYFKKYNKSLLVLWFGHFRCKLFYQRL